MHYGKLVKANNGELYKLVQDMTAEENTVFAVNMNNFERWHLLKTWNNNQVGLTDEQREEMASYIIALDIDNFRPNNKVKFITSDYKTLFEVTDLDEVKFIGYDGEEENRRVIFLDETHFSFLGGSCYHIHEFATKCKKNGCRVEQLT